MLFRSHRHTLLVQLLYQVVVLFGEALHGCGERLDYLSRAVVGASSWTSLVVAIERVSTM